MFVNPSPGLFIPVPYAFNFNQPGHNATCLGRSSLCQRNFMKLCQVQRSACNRMILGGRVSAKHCGAFSLSFCPCPSKVITTSPYLLCIKTGALKHLSVKENMVHTADWHFLARKRRISGPHALRVPSYFVATSERTIHAVHSSAPLTGDDSQLSTKTSKCISLFKQMTSNFLISGPPQAFKLNASLPMNFAAVFGIIAAVSVLAILNFLSKPGKRSGGSVGELVKRGQLRSDRKYNSRPLKYEDPFNNPMIKMGGKNPLVRMCGKIFRVQPVTLTSEKILSHQTRRIHAYQWKRPTVFLIEGEPVPEDVDPDTVRWIPSNHPFATAENEIDEVSAEMNVYQTRGVPSRVRAEHEALRKKMMSSAQNRMNSSVMYAGASQQGNGTSKVFVPSQAQPNPEFGSISNSVRSVNSTERKKARNSENATRVSTQSTEPKLPHSGRRLLDGSIDPAGS